MKKKYIYLSHLNRKMGRRKIKGGVGGITAKFVTELSPRERSDRVIDTIKEKTKKSVDSAKENAVRALKNKEILKNEKANKEKLEVEKIKNKSDN